jgi:hypothetical protein
MKHSRSDIPRMVKLTLENLFLFLSHFVLFSIWLKLGQRSAFDPAHWSRAFMGLVIAGFLSIALYFIGIGLFAERHLGAYVPAHTENGQLIPGGFK